MVHQVFDGHGQPPGAPYDREFALWQNTAGTTVYSVIQSAESLPGIMGPYAIGQTIGVWRVERQSVVLDADSPSNAWQRVADQGLNETKRQAGVGVSNPGWSKGTGTEGTSGVWGAWMWQGEERLAGWTTLTNQNVTTNGGTGMIARVMVGTFGDFGPTNRFEAYGPHPDWTEPTSSTYQAYQVDERAFYRMDEEMLQPVNDGDVDRDGVIDWNDGFNQNTADTNDDRCPGLVFELMPVYLPPSDEVTQSWVRVAYDTGKVRVWLKDGFLARSISNAPSGDLVAPGDYMATNLGYSATQCVQRFYIEGMGAGATNPVTFSFSPDGGSWLVMDRARVSVLNCQIAMDGNRDDSITFGDTNDNHYLFWVNDDIDIISGGEEDDAESGTANCNDGSISCMRDLEDFTRLHIKVDENTANLTGITYFLKIENISSGSPTANIFEAVSELSVYLSDTNIAHQQIQKIKLMTTSNSEQQLPNQYIKTNNLVSPFILEGKSAGKGDLTLIVKKDRNEVCRKSIALDLRPIAEFSEKYVVTISAGDNVNTASSQGGPCTYTPENNEYVLHVHGWNMAVWEKDRWTETVFKRLWWQRYKGHVGGFQWPTYTGSLSYDVSELRAWRSGEALKNCITSLNATYPGQVRVLAHSMGNVVMGEALRLFSSSVVHTYIAAQAAIPAHCYDNTVTNYWTGFNTPNIYGRYSTGQLPDTPYLGANINFAGAMVAYFNTSDYALGWWETGNEMKPDINYWNTDGDANMDSYVSTSGDRFYYDNILVPFDERTMAIPDDRFEIFARIVESRSRALGREPSVAGFGIARNLKDWGYNEQHYSHSREFRSNVADEWSFWTAVIEDAHLNE